MTSARKIVANRANARASTGPKTAAGCARSARNAIRHGLNVPIRDLDLYSHEVENLSRVLAGNGITDPSIQESALAAAEALIDFKRARQARHRLLADKWAQRDYQNRHSVRMKAELLRQGYLPRMMRIPFLRGVLKSLDRFPEGPEKFALILQQEAKQLALFDRYESRARRRRDRAILALDQVRLVKTTPTK